MNLFYFLYLPPKTATNFLKNVITKIATTEINKCKVHEVGIEVKTDCKKDPNNPIDKILTAKIVCIISIAF